MTTATHSAQDLIQLEADFGANNYKPLDIVIERAEGCWVWDVDGNKYMDCLSAYSAVNQGHCHPKLLQVLKDQAHKVTLTSRAFRNDQLPKFYQTLNELTGYEMSLPMNSGAEAVETAIKMARRWGYTKKGIPNGQAEIIVCADNFHGRTTTIVGFSTEDDYKAGFGPFTPGFKVVPLGDLDALKAAITPNTCAFMFEPIQGEAGINIPPEGYVKAAIDLCKQHNVLSIADEIQCGLGRAGSLFAYQGECNKEECDRKIACEGSCEPDAVIIGKALSGGFYPVSAVLSSKEILGVFNPGTHGSTFGGNPLGCAIATKALEILIEENLITNSATLGPWLLEELKTINNPHIKEIRGKGLMIGIEMDEKVRKYCEALKEKGLLCKETHDTVIRLTPPLVVTKDELRWAVAQIKAVLEG